MSKISIFILAVMFMTSSIAEEKKDIPKFKDYKVEKIYKGKNHPAIIKSDHENMYRTRLKWAAKELKPSFAGHYIVTYWGCGAGCRYGAIINAKTGKVIDWPTLIGSVHPLKPEFLSSKEMGGPEHIYKLNSRLMIFAGNTDMEGDREAFSDIILFYELKNEKFTLIKSMPYGRKAKE